mgnify:CR=1 FL=1
MLEGWKKCRNNVMVHLQVTSDAQWIVCNEAWGWYRSSEVLILEVIGGEYGVSLFDNTEYHPGKIVRSDKYTGLPTGCCHGIHFFLTREKAEEY